MTRTVEYCLRNVDDATRRRLDALDGPEVIGKRCLQRCGDCYRDAVLVVDGDLVAGADHADLLSAVETGGDEEGR